MLKDDIEGKDGGFNDEIAKIPENEEGEQGPLFSYPKATAMRPRTIRMERRVVGGSRIPLEIGKS